jgi:putative transposase
MLKAEGYAVEVGCRVLDLPRSSFYYQPQAAADEALRGAIEAIGGEFSTYGSRRVTAQLRRPPYALVVNRKRVQRVMRQMGLQGRVKRRQRHTTHSNHPYPRYPNLVKGLTVAFPDQVWVADITYIRLRVEFIFLAVIMDVFTRAIRGWHLSRSLDQALTLTALQRALADHSPLIHHSDQGVQYAATDYADLLTTHGVQISMAAVGKPEENGFAERLIRTIKEEEVDLSDYHDYADALSQIGHFIEEVYQTKRIHSALGYLTPVEFEAAWAQTQTEQMSSLIPC